MNADPCQKRGKGTALLLLVGALLLLVVQASLLNAAIVYSSFGPGESYSGLAYSINGEGAQGNFYQAVAAPFQVSESGYLSSVRVPLVYSSGQNAFEIRVALDESGLPGEVLDAMTVGDVPWFPGAVKTATSSIHPWLATGGNYWIEVLPTDWTTYGGWLTRDEHPNYGSNTPAFNHYSYWSLGSPQGPFAFSVDVTLVPEPIAAMALPALTLLLVRRRAKR